MSSQKHVGLLISSGPEVRAFIHSGLAGRLAEAYEVTVLTRFPSSAAFQDLHGIRVATIPEAEMQPTVQRVRGWARGAHAHWLRQNGMERWRHYLPESNGHDPNRQRVLARIAGHAGVVRLFSAIERCYGRACGNDPHWTAAYRDMCFDGIVTGGFSSSTLLPALQTARNTGIKTFVLTNSWKDVYVTSHVPVTPTRLGVWNERTADFVSAVNPHLKKDEIVVVGSLHLEKFLRPERVMSREAFCQLQGLDPRRPYICYTAASPRAVRNEECVLDALAAAIEAGILPTQIQLLLRLNPMEDGSRFAGLTQHRRCVVVQKPRWEWNEQADWCCPFPEDGEMWLATAFHAEMNISVASTVTLEFAALGRPVVNVCFDLPGDLSQSLSARRFWDAEFYNETRESGFAVPAFSVQEMISLTRECLEKSTRPGEPTQKVFAFPPVDEALRHILAGLSE
jgi:hypothetical protein